MKRGTNIVAMLLLMSFHINVKIISCSGRIEIQIDHVYNIYGTLMNGLCCEGTRSDTKGNFCTGTCRTYLTFCVGDVHSKQDCRYGRIITPVLGRHKNTIRFPITNDVGNKLIRDQVNKLSDSNREDVPEYIFKNLLTFNISNGPNNDQSPLLGHKQRGYYVKMEARHRIAANVSESDPLISQQTYNFSYTQHNIWKTQPYLQRGADVIFHSRVLCDQYYYQDTCQVFCREHHDHQTNLNWRCLQDGTRECLPGWKGRLCDQPICNKTCNSKFGCIRPGVCGCPLGYQGENCDQCVVDPLCDPEHSRCITSYQCLCKPGWGGRRCHIDLDICRFNQCKNGGECIPNQDMDHGGYTCQCTPGFGGQNCTKKISACHSQPCQNNGVCIAGASLTEYSCRCPKGTSGKNCEHEIQYCAPKPCANGGECIEKVEGYECTCASGWEGENCTIDKNECASNPCVNAVHCKDLFNDYHCACQPGWSGKQCDKDINDCKGQCRNNASCIDKVNDFRCVCPKGFTGKICDKNIDDCTDNPCRHDGVCVDLVGTYECVCQTGYHGERCEKQIDLCKSAPCKNGANCSSMLNDYRCQCPVGWTGKDCSIHKPKPIDKNENVNTDKCHLCKHNSTCTVVTTNNVTTSKCTCRDGYEGAFCETDINDCANMTCENSGICIDRIGDFKCVCQPGFTGRKCEINIDECESSPCQNGGTCSDGVNMYHCACAAGFQGYDCSSNIDECATTICHNNATCVDGIDSYKCKCRYAYHGDHCEHGPDYCYDDPCGEHGVCSQGNGTFTCSCIPGYTGRTCAENIDDCAHNPCRNGGVCIDKVNAFECRCSLGHHGDVCQYNDTCLAQPCSNGGVCKHQGNDYHCECPRSFFGKDCTEVENPCFIPRYLNKAKNMTVLMSAGHCSKHGTCKPLQDGGFTCDCDEEWTGERCQLRKNYCIDNNCKNQATCINLNTPGGVGGYKCLCPIGFEGIYCQINSDNCESSPCKNGGKCIDQQDDFVCECKHGWKGKTCLMKSSSCGSPNPCQNNGQCIEEGDSFRCQCQPNYTGKTCNVKLTPCDTAVCMNGGTCLNNGTTYRCKCPVGFLGKHCEQETLECAVKPCLNGGKCVEGPMMYNCECKPGYTGANCQFDIDECASMPCPRGMECIDKVATFQCVCPRGRTGKNCEEKVPDDHCQIGEVIRKHNETWQDCCNYCICSNGIAKCTKKFIAPSNCFEKAAANNCTCVQKQNADCITPPCQSWGECEVKVAQAQVTTGGCMPDIGQEKLDMNCAKVVIVFERRLLPPGLHMERVCEEFRYLDISQSYKISHELKLLCIRSGMDANINMMNISVSSKLNAAHVALELAKTFTSLIPQDNVLSSIRHAMVNVTVERHAHWSPLTQDQNGSSFLIPSAAGIALFALMLLLFVCIYAFKKRRKAEELNSEIFFTKKKNVFQKPVEKNTNRERSFSKGDPHCELLDPNMYFEGSGKKFLPLALHPRDEIVV